MVAVKSSEAERFLKRPPPNIFLYLICGSDAGLVSERAQALIAQAIEDPKDPFQFLRLSGDDLAADPLRLADEANTMPLFGGSRAIAIEAQGKAFMAAIEPLLACAAARLHHRDRSRQPEARLGSAPALRKRRACRRHRMLSRFGEGSRPARRNGIAPPSILRSSPTPRRCSISLLGQDRLSTRGEIGKLVLYARGEGEVKVEHVEAIVADASALALDKAIDGAFEGDFAAIETTAERVFSEGGDYNLLLGAALRHATLLHRMRLDAETGRAAATQHFAGGFRRSATLDRHVRTWSSSRLARAIGILSQAIGKARREPLLADMITVRALWSVALAARNKPA